MRYELQIISYLCRQLWKKATSAHSHRPYCFFNLISPLMSIIVAAIGWKIRKINE